MQTTLNCFQQVHRATLKWSLPCVIKLNSNYSNQRCWMWCRHTCWETKTFIDRDVKIVNKSEKKMRHRLRFCPWKLTYSVALKEWIASMLKKNKENCKVTRNLNWKMKRLLDVSGLVLQGLSCHSVPFGEAVSIVADNRD